MEASPQPWGNFPTLRVRALNVQPVRCQRPLVLYWMTAFRRSAWNFSLDRALSWCQGLGKPLLVLEALRADYPWASRRLHQFVLEGMLDNQSALPNYYAYVEPVPSAGKGLVAALAAHAAVVVTDDYPCFFLPAMARGLAQRVDVCVEAVDSNGLLPLRAAEREFPTAYAFRRFLQRTLPQYLGEMPKARPLSGWQMPPLPASVLKPVQQHWPPANVRRLLKEGLRQLPIDQDVGPAAFSGGVRAAVDALSTFVRDRLQRYDERQHPDLDAASGLSPYLHFGHLSAHQVFARVAHEEAWTPEKLSRAAHGKKQGWWGMSAPAEAFLDELVTWRELGFNFCHQRDDYAQYQSLPEWARATLHKHARDKRPYCYDLEELEAAATHDAIWNAAQRQLVREGRLHNYLRMLWGKKILEWSRTPEVAWEAMIHLNNKYAVDGRDPNSYSGISWCLGRFDRPWFPERPIFGTIRYMSSDNTQRKLKMQHYLERYGA